MGVGQHGDKRGLKVIWKRDYDDSGVHVQVRRGRAISTSKYTYTVRLLHED